MANDADWVADVRRWYLAGAQAKVAAATPADDTEAAELGYEAAYPTLQAHHWPDAPCSAVTDPK